MVSQETTLPKQGNIKNSARELWPVTGLYFCSSGDWTNTFSLVSIFAMVSSSPGGSSQMQGRLPSQYEDFQLNTLRNYVNYLCIYSSSKSHDTGLNWLEFTCVHTQLYSFMNYYFVTYVFPLSCTDTLHIWTHQYKKLSTIHLSVWWSLVIIKYILLADGGQF